MDAKKAVHIEIGKGRTNKKKYSLYGEGCNWSG